MPRPISHALATLAVAATTLSSCGGDGDDASAGAGAAARQDTNVQLVDACELIAQAQLEPVLGAAQDKPTSNNMGFDEKSPIKHSLCTYAGASSSIVLKLTYPYWETPATTEEWAAKVREDYVESVKSADDAEVAALLGNVQIHPLDGLSVIAAWIDLREQAHQVVLHAIKEGSQRTYLELYASDLETARAVTEKLAAALP